jgi:hypothetical protein
VRSSSSDIPEFAQFLVEEAMTAFHLIDTIIKGIKYFGNRKEKYGATINQPKQINYGNVQKNKVVIVTVPFRD